MIFSNLREDIMHVCGKVHLVFLSMVFILIILIITLHYCILPLYRFLLVMPAYSAKDNALAVKLVTGFPENAKQGLPSFIANVMVLDSTNGVPQAVSLNLFQTKFKV